MANSPYVDVRKVIDTTAEQRKPVDFLHTKKITNVLITFSSASWVATPGHADGEYYQDFTITGLTNKHAAIVILNTHASAYLDRGNFTTCFTTIDGKLRLHWTAPIVSNSQITIPTIITFETGNTAPIRGLLNGGGGGSGGTGDWVYDPADMSIFIDYLSALGDLSSYYLEIQDVIDGFATYFTTGVIDADKITANSIDTRHLVVHSPNLINDFDSFEQFKDQNLAGMGGEPLVPVNYSGTVTANVVNTTAFHGLHSLYLTNTSSNDYIYLNPNTFSVVNWIKLESAGAYGLSFYAKVNDAVLTNEYGVLSLYDVSGTPTLVGTAIPLMATNGLWKRFFVKFTLGAAKNATLRLDFSRATSNFYIDGIQLERLESINDDISSFASGGTTIISGDNITTGSINATLITTGELDAQYIKAGSIEATKIAANTITANEIAANTITADEIVANTITAAEIAALTITAAEIAANTITGNKIAAGTITADNLATDSITANKIKAGEITADKLSATFGNFLNTLTVGASPNHITITGNASTAKIYTGPGNHGARDTGFYIDDDGNFSLSNQLIFTPGTEDTLSELQVNGKIRGIIENIIPIPTGKLVAAITNTVLSSAGAVGTVTTSGHAFLANEKIVIENMTNAALNREYVIVTIVNSTTFTISTSGLGLGNGTYTGTSPTASLRELTMGFHPAEGTGTSYEHSAGSGIRLDKYNWWLSNNQFRVGHASSYFKWNGSKFNIAGSGTKTLSLGVGSADADNYIAIANNGVTPAYNNANTQFFAGGDGTLSLGQGLLWNGSALVINGTIKQTSVIETGAGNFTPNDTLDYRLDVAGGSRTILYNALGASPTPSTSAAFTITPRIGAQAWTIDKVTVSWTATGVLTGTSSTFSYTPTISGTFSSTASIITVSVSFYTDSGKGTLLRTITEAIGVSVTQVGTTGTAGRGISSTAITYQAHTNGTTAPTGTWLTDPPAVTASQFLWTRTIITYTDATTSTSYSVGQMGATGAAGRGISSTDTTYQSHTNGTTPPVGTWTTAVPSVPASNYLWTRVIITYTDASTSTSYSVGLMGAQGPQGTSGLNTAVISLYRRFATSPTLPSTSSTYTFSTGVLTGHNNSWTQNVPTSDGNPLWITQAVATATAPTDTDTIAAGEWVAAVKLAEDGAAGAAGFNQATISLYQRATSTPVVTDIADPITYTFSTGAITGTLGFWSRAVPSGTNPVYVISAAAISSTATDTIARSEWSTPVVMSQNGANGVDSTVYYLEASALAIFKDAIDAATTGTHTTTTFTGKQSVGSVITNNIGFLTVQNAAGTYIIGTAVTAVALSSPQTLSPATNAATTFYTAKFYNQATVSGATTYDTVVIPVIFKGATGTAGVDGITGILANQAHTLPASATGVVSSYVGSGTTIQVYEGSTLLQFNTVIANSRFTIGTPVIAPAATITVGARTGSGTTTAIVADHSAMSNSTDSLTITYPITARRANGTDVTFNLVQTITKSKLGVGITSIVAYYLATSASSGVTTATPGFTTAIQTMTLANKYLWSYDKITYTNASVVDTLPIIMGTYGDTGSTGVAGRSISAITEYYLVSTLSTGVTRATGGWTTTMQTMTSINKYLWNYKKLDYINPTSTEYVEPVVVGVYGDSGRGISTTTIEYQVDDSGTVVPFGSWLLTIPSTTPGQFLWTRTTILYTDSSTSISYSVAMAGPTGPGIVYRGEYSATQTYFSESGRRDVVLYTDNNYYIAKVTVVQEAWDIAKWELFGAQYTSIATGLLLTEDAHIKRTLTVGTNILGNTANITLNGIDAEPYLSILQAEQSIMQTGIYLGADGFSIVDSVDKYLKWQTGSLVISGEVIIGASSYKERLAYVDSTIATLVSADGTLTSTIQGLTNGLATTNTTLTQTQTSLNLTINSLDELKTYYNFTETSLTIGRNDSPAQIIIGYDVNSLPQMILTDGMNDTARISSNTLNIKNATIAQTLITGNHKIEKLTIGGINYTAFLPI